MAFAMYDEADPARISNDIIPPLYAPPLPASTPPYITLDDQELTAEQLHAYLANNDLLPPSSTPCIPFIEDKPESFLPVGRANIYLGECLACGETEDGAVAYPAIRKNAAVAPADRRRKLFLLRCATCHALVHPHCLQPPLSLMTLLAVSTRLSGGPSPGKPSAFSAALWNEWRCARCKCCSMCQSPPEPARPLLVCDSCDRGYHPECTRETLTVRPLPKGHDATAPPATDPAAPLTVADTVFYCADCVGRTLAPSEKRQFEYVKAQYKKKLRRMFPQHDNDSSDDDGDDDDDNTKRSNKKSTKKKKNKEKNGKTSSSAKKKKAKKEKEKEREKEKRKKKRRKSEGHRSNNADSSAADDTDDSDDDDDDDDDDSASHVSRKRKKNRSSHSNKPNKK